MATYYINADSGDDGTGDGSSGNPWLTLATAITNSTTSDTIVCQDSAAAYTWANQTITDRTIQATTLGDAVFDASSGSIRWLLRGTVNITNLEFKDRTGANVDLNPCFGWDTDGTVATFTGCKVYNIVLHDSNAGGHASVWAPASTGTYNMTLTVDNCLCYDVTQASSGREGAFFAIRGITGGYTVTNSVFATDEPAGSTNMQYFLYARQSAADFTMTNCIVYAEDGALAWSGGFSWTGTETVTYCDTYNVTSDPAGTGNITDDPLFIDVANANYNLRPTSPCIGTGTLT